MKIKSAPVEKVKLRFAVILCLFSFFLTPTARGQEHISEFNLATGWFIQQDSAVKVSDSQISSPEYNTGGWFPASVPSTVLGALVNDGVYKHPFFGRNLEKIPLAPFRKSWWFRKKFDLPGKIPFRNAVLTFQGINYSANIWLNGVRIASADSVKGAYRVWHLNITRELRNSGNVLAVQVFPPQPGDFTMGFVDWTPQPNDHNMGLFRPVTIRLSGTVSLRHTYVQSSVDVKTLKSAALTISTEASNHSAKPQPVMIRGSFGHVSFMQRLTLKPFETRTVTFTPQTNPTLNIENPKLWWPYTMGKPNLYHLSLKIYTGATESDHQSITFGIREVSDYMTPEGYRGYKVNGRKIQIRGGGWADHLLLRGNAQNLEDQIKYTRLMHLNTIRLEGFWGCSQTLYNLCDRYGILMMVGWSCQWEWESYVGKPADDFGAVSSPADIELISKSWDDQVKMFRNHPSIYVWVYGSDKLPRPALEEKYLASLKTLDPSRPTLASCANRTSAVTGKTGVKMEGPYDYVTPNYWYLDTTHGGAYGYNTETGPGPQIPPLESLEKMIPADSLWPINNLWNFHCGRNEFHTLNRYLNALNERYGPPSGLNDFEKKAQLMNYEAIRAMYEAFAVNRAHATGVIQWMLNAPWPKLYWQLYDYYLNPNGAFYGTQTACKPLNIIYNYGDGNIYVTNDFDKPIHANAEIQVFDLNSRVILTRSVPFQLGKNSSRKIFNMPALKNITPVYFIDLRINGTKSKILARNFYWLSTKKDVPDESKSTWFVTPNKAFADFTALKHMPSARVVIKKSFLTPGSSQSGTVSLTNTSHSIAFFVHLTLKNKKTGAVILPVFWNENDVSILPGETRTLRVSFPASQSVHEVPRVVVNGWNLK